MKIGVLGSGSREFMIGLKIKESPKCSKLVFLPGNGGTKNLGENIDIDVNDFVYLSKIIDKENLDLLVVGPETPLVGGIVDFLNLKNPHLKIIGPNQNASKLEGSKAFAKNFMKKYNIPTAKYEYFKETDLNLAIEFLKTLKPPYVIKADGLAAGKGVAIVEDFNQAVNTIKEYFAGKFGMASQIAVIEEFLKGIELSVFIATDGKDYILLPTAKDYKRIGDNDTGPNTGGMGAIAPVPFANDEFMQKVENTIIKPTLKGLQNEGIIYKGFLYFGLMNVNGDPYVIEYNCRLGDPETEVVLPLIESDFVDLLLAISDENLTNYQLKVKNKKALCVVIASKGYPDFFEKNKLITFGNIDTDIIISHGGTKFEFHNYYSTAGRVLCLTALAENLQEARNTIYSNIDKIFMENKYYRSDIGLDIINKYGNY